MMTRAAKPSTERCAPSDSWATLVARAWVPDGWQPRIWAIRCDYMARQCRDAERAGEWAALRDAVTRRWGTIEAEASEYERIIQSAYVSGG